MTNEYGDYLCPNFLVLMEEVRVSAHFHMTLLVSVTDVCIFACLYFLQMA